MSFYLVHLVNTLLQQLQETSTWPKQVDWYHDLRLRSVLESVIAILRRVDPGRGKTVGVCSMLVCQNAHDSSRSSSMINTEKRRE